MKTFWSWLAKILLVIVVIEAWFLYDMNTKYDQLIADNVELEKELLASKESLTTAEERIAELENNSLEGILEETNKAVVSGLETLLDTVEDELKKARQSINSTMDDLKKEPQSKAEEPNPSMKSPSAENPSTDSDAKTDDSISSEPNPEPIKGERT